MAKVLEILVSTLLPREGFELTQSWYYTCSGQSLQSGFMQSVSLKHFTKVDRNPCHLAPLASSIASLFSCRQQQQRCLTLRITMEQVVMSGYTPLLSLQQLRRRVQLMLSLPLEKKRRRCRPCECEQARDDSSATLRDLTSKYMT